MSSPLDELRFYLSGVGQLGPRARPGRLHQPAGASIFDSWRQLTVEHLIGESQGGYRRQIVVDLATRFPELADEQIGALASEIDAANTVTACSFCNSTTSRTRCARGMSELIASCPDNLDEVVQAIALELGQVRDAKRADVRWKLASVRRAYEQRIAPGLLAARDATHESA